MKEIGKQFEEGVEFEFCDNNNPSLKPHLSNDDFVAVVGRGEFLLLNDHGEFDKSNTVAICLFDPDRNVHPEDTFKGYHDFIQMQFWDVEEPIGRIIPISDEQGKELFDFISKNKDKRFLIHCEAGMSRSAGVAQAVETIKHFESSPYFFRTGFSAISEFGQKTGRYSPNLTVFDSIFK